MIHRLNYHDKWPTSDYELQNYNTRFVFLCHHPTWLEDKVGEWGVDITCRVYSVVPDVCVEVCECVVVVVVVGVGQVRAATIMGRELI